MIVNPGALCVHCCSDTEQHASAVAANVGEVFGNVATDVRFAWMDREGDLFKSYNFLASQNEGLHKPSDLLVFIHDDARFLKASKAKLEALWNASDLGGVVGVAGATRINRDGTWWGEKEEDFIRLGDPCRGRVRHPDRGWLTWPAGGPPQFGRVQVVDGLMLAMRRSTFERVDGFDKSLHGVHFYDICISLQAALSGGANQVIDLPMEHDSLGSYNKDWGAARDRFVKSWLPFLPLSI